MLRAALRRSHRQQQPLPDHVAGMTDEIYNLGAQSHVAVSFEAPEYAVNFDTICALRILETMKMLDISQKTRI